MATASAVPDDATTTTVELRVSLTKGELGALRQAHEHVRVHMAHQHSWEIRDTAMAAIGSKYAISFRIMIVLLKFRV